MMNSIVETLKKKGYTCNTEAIFSKGVLQEGIGILTANGYIILTSKEIMDIYGSVYEAVNSIEKEMGSPYWQRSKDKIKVCIQSKTSNTLIEKKDFLNLECYLRIFQNDGTTKKITVTDMSEFKVPAETVWKIAWENTKKDTIVCETGIDHIYIASSGIKCGASIMCDVNILKKIATKHNSNVLIIPASENNIFLVPEGKSDRSAAEFAEMLREVNSHYYANALSYNIYKYDKDKKEIYIEC